MKSSEQKEFEWKEKRRGKITASTLPDLMKAVMVMISAVSRQTVY